MSHSPPNYTDGVPVKISEKYKPPPEIHLTSKLLQQLSKTKVPVAFEDDYNFNLERKIISKTSEWINWRLKERTERQQRIHQRELNRQKRLDDEQKEKLNQVSYPSGDELTSSCDEDEDNNVNEATHSNNDQQSIPTVTEKPFSPSNFSSNTILMPTQVLLQPEAKKSHRRYASNSSNKIDFSFFESDASPFDHLEMKSMNEMEELAKVLKSTTVENNESDENVLERNNSSESESSDHQKNNNNNVDVSAIPVTVENSLTLDGIPASSTTATVNNQLYYNNPQLLYNNYYYGATSGCNQTYYNATHFTAAPKHHLTSPYIMNHPQQPPQQPNNCYYTQNYAVNHMNYTPAITGNNNNMACDDYNDKMDVASKSKSVPDIFKELNDELNNSQRRRIRNHSQNSHKEVEIEKIESKCYFFFKTLFLFLLLYFFFLSISFL